jgi:hypothetical protein
MKKLFFLALLAAYGAPLRAQLYTAQSGETSFFSKAPLEDISAVNKKVGAVLNTATGDIAVRIPMTEFQFPNKLMQEHFNENYVESDKYPTATFRGKIQEAVEYAKPGTYPVTAQGTLDLHGVKQERTLKGTLTVAEGRLTIQADFPIALKDHQIEIPKLVFQKIAETIAVKNNWVLVPRK